jgi:hypothetical protein
MADRNPATPFGPVALNGPLRSAITLTSYGAEPGLDEPELGLEGELELGLDEPELGLDGEPELGLDEELELGLDEELELGLDEELELQAARLEPIRMTRAGAIVL